MNNNIHSDLLKELNLQVARRIRVTCCWHCKRTDRTLKRLRDDNGKKTQDYICTLCLELGFMKPDIANSSFLVKEEYEKA